MPILVGIVLKGGFLLKTCSEKEALAILRDQSVLPFLQFYPEGVKDVEKYLVNDKVLLIVMPDNKDVEVHIAVKYRDRAYIRKSLKMAIEWLKYRGFECIWTTAPDTRKALTNLLTSLGFKKSDERWLLWA